MQDMTSHLAADEQQVVSVVQRYADSELVPKATKTDETGIYVRGQLNGLSALGVLGANLPEAWGGAGLSSPALLATVAAIAAACGSTASALTAHYLATDSILLGGNEEQRQKWLPRAAIGEALGAFALTEPTAGSDPADMKTRAQKTPQGWHLSGAKCFISNGGEADFIAVYAMTQPTLAHRGISAFIVPKDTKGLVVGKPERTMGIKGGHVFALSFDCILPQEALLGGVEGQGFKTAMKVLDNGRIEVAAMCLGIAQAALKAAISHAKERMIGGEALANRQGIRWQLADMAVDLRAAFLVALDAAKQREAAHRGGPRFSLAAAQAKLVCSEMAGRVTDGALQIHGGYGYTRDFPLERYVRDARIMRIYEGSSEIQRNIISAHLLS